MNPWFGYPPMDQYLEWLRQNQQGTQAKPAPAPVQQEQTQPRTNISWVQGAAAAEAYFAAHPLTRVGDTVAVWDSGDQTIYVKHIEDDGKPVTKILDYSIREPKPAPEYATKASVDALATKIDELLQAITPPTVEENKDG